MRAHLLARWLLVLGLVVAVCAGCRGTVRCEEGFYFDENGQCVAASSCPAGRDPATGICRGDTDGGPSDGGTTDGAAEDGGPDAGPSDGGVDAGGSDAGPDDCAGACSECETCVAGSCEPVAHGDSCTDGTCYEGSCCQGCWDGAACQAGTATSACGAGGGECVSCGCASDSCTAGACEPLGGGVVDFDATSHLCAVLADGSLYCFGRNSEGQLGLGDTVDRVMPVQVLAGTSWQTIEAGDRHSCAVSTTPAMFCWGDNEQGQLGLGDTMRRTAPTRVTEFSFVTSLAAGARTAVADGAFYAWGASVTSPVLIASSSPSSWRELDACEEQNCIFGIRADGTLWASDFLGGLEQVGTENDWETVDAGIFNACAINSTGDLFCIGDNTGGGLGFGTDGGFNSAFVMHVGFSDWSRVSVGRLGICAVRSTGELYCGGEFGSTLRELSSSRVGVEADWSDVRFVGGATTLYALKVDGTLWSFGSDPFAGDPPARVCF